MPELRLLPTLAKPHSDRSAMTCEDRCHDACDHAGPNQSGNPHIGDILTATISRRSVLKGGAAGAAAMVATAADRSLAAAATSGNRRDHTSSRISRLDFSPVEPNRRDNVTLPHGYRYDVVVRWGDPVVAGAPAFDAYRQTPESQAVQFGYNCDYVGMVALGKDRAVLAVNNEYTDEALMFPDGHYDDDAIKRITMQAHGVSVLEVKRGRSSGSWKRVSPKKAKHNRRVTATTPMRLTGPAAGDDRLRTRADRSGRVVQAFAM